MAGNPALITRSIRRATSPDLPSIVEAVGSDRFAPRLLAFLNELCGADHVAMFQFGQDSLREVAAESLDGSHEAREQVARYLDQQYWRRDPAVAEMRECIEQSEPAIIQVDIGRLDPEFRAAIYPHVGAKVVICGRRLDAGFGLSMLRSVGSGDFPEEAVDRLAPLADMLICVVAKHTDIILRRPNLASALASLSDIERCIAAKADLPRRELGVCARILYGISSIGIALDLGIGEESVKTYRKRAYERLHLGSERELLKWYLALWGEYQTDLDGVGVVPTSGNAV